MLAAQGNYGQPGVMPAGYPYPHYMMPGYAPPPPAGKTGKGAAAAGEPPAKGSRKRRKRIPQGGPKKPATSFVLFSNTVREQVCSSRAHASPATGLSVRSLLPAAMISTHLKIEVGDKGRCVNLAKRTGEGGKSGPVVPGPRQEAGRDVA